MSGGRGVSRAQDNQGRNNKLQRERQRRIEGRSESDRTSERLVARRRRDGRSPVEGQRARRRVGAHVRRRGREPRRVEVLGVDGFPPLVHVRRVEPAIGRESSTIGRGSSVNGSRRRRGRDADIPWRRRPPSVARIWKTSSTPRPRRWLGLCVPEGWAPSSSSTDRTGATGDCGGGMLDDTEPRMRAPEPYLRRSAGLDRHKSPTVPLDVDGPWTRRGDAADAARTFRRGARGRGATPQRRRFATSTGPRNIHVAAAAGPRPAPRTIKPGGGRSGGLSLLRTSPAAAANHRERRSATRPLWCRLAPARSPRGRLFFALTRNGDVTATWRDRGKSRKTSVPESRGVVPPRRSRRSGTAAGRRDGAGRGREKIWPRRRDATRPLFQRRARCG